MKKPRSTKKYDYHAIWISDVHLGYKGCRAEFLLDFLETSRSDYLYLVGDIIDIWNMKKGLYWPQSHNDVVRKVLSKAKNGTRVIYVPGNHDELLREYDGMTFGNIEIHNRAIHKTIDGKSFLILHGDEFDSVVKCNRLLAILGNHAYDILLEINRGFNLLRRKCGFPYWSLAAYLKHKIKNAVQFIGEFESAVAHEARKHGMDGVVCGHIHHAEIRKMDDVIYFNDGDWVENCTALVEHHDGTMELMHWSDKQHSIKNDIGPAIDRIRTAA